MTWVGWFLIVELVGSLVIHIAKNGERKPRSSGELAFLAIETAAIVIAILAIGTGSL